VRIPQKFYRSINNMRGANPGDVWEFFPYTLLSGKQAKPSDSKTGRAYRKNDFSILE